MITLSVISVFLFPSFMLALVGLGILIYGTKINKNINPKFYPIGALLFAQVFILAFIALGIDKNNDEKERVRLRVFLTEKNLKVSLDEKQLDSIQTKELITALKTIADVDAHHSHSVNTISIKLISPEDSLVLEIGQDSERPKEYWVFSGPDKNQIGRINSDVEIKATE